MPFFVDDGSVLVHHDPPAPIDHCPVCGVRARESGPYTICASCGAPVDHETVLVEGSRPPGLPAWVLLSFWIIPLSLALAAHRRDVAIIVMVLFLVHAAIAGCLAWTRARRSAVRLFLTRDGIGMIGIAGAMDVRPYHLFDDVRLRALPGAEPLRDGARVHRWRLTIVNAYKPSISVYLHSRGTDMPIFCNSIDLIVDVDADAADALHGLLQRRIDDARAAYRPTRMREVDQLNIVRRRFRRRATCPNCTALIEGSPQDDQCPRCLAFVVFSPDQPRFVLDAAPINWNPGVAFASVAVAIVTLWPLITGTWLQILPLLIPAAALAAWCWIRVMDHERATGDQVLVTPHGFETWIDGQCEARHSWQDLPTLRFVQLERGSWRIALWPERAVQVTFSPFLFTWFTSPRLHPAFDLVLRDLDLPGRMICEEIAARHARARGLHAFDARLHLDERAHFERADHPPALRPSRDLNVDALAAGRVF